MFFSLDASLFPIVFLIVLAIAALSSIIFKSKYAPFFYSHSYRSHCFTAYYCLDGPYIK